MITLEKDAVACPFSGHSEELVNIKFFRGHRDDVITCDEISEQFRSANVQFADGTATVSQSTPTSDHPVVDVRDYIARL